MLEIFHRGKANKNLVVFIHGLQGNKDTWVNSAKKPFPHLLMEEKEIKKRFDFSYFDYYSKIFPAPAIAKHAFALLVSKIGGKGGKVLCNLDVKMISNLLLTYLETHASQYENIFLVCHSMGGLIAKSLIIHNKNKDLIKKIKIVFSLAVPHNGSNLASIGKLVSSNVQITNLAPLDEYRKEINQEWINNKESNPRIIYFLGSYDIVVNNASSIGYDANEIDIKYCDEDHSTIAKPESKDSIVFATVKSELLGFINQQKLNEEIEKKSNSENIDELENEVFVIKLMIANVHGLLIKNAKLRFFDAERARKIYTHLGLKDEIDHLYESISQIYVTAFAELLSGKITDGVELVNLVYKTITEEDKNLLKSIAKINHLHKIGMIHQLANVDNDIWWARNQNIKTLEEFIKQKGENK